MYGAASLPSFGHGRAEGVELEPEHQAVPACGKPEAACRGGIVEFIYLSTSSFLLSHQPGRNSPAGACRTGGLPACLPPAAGCLPARHGAAVTYWAGTFALLTAILQELAYLQAEELCWAILSSEVSACSAATCWEEESSILSGNGFSLYSP